VRSFFSFAAKRELKKPVPILLSSPQERGMEAGIRAQRSSYLSFVSKGGSQEVDLVPRF